MMANLFNESTISAFSNLATSIAEIIALFLIFRQLKYQSKQIEFDALMKLHKEIIGSTMHYAFQFIYSKEPQYLAQPKNGDELKMIEIILNTYDLIGFRVKKGILPLNATLETEWTVLIRIWSQLSLFIENERQLRNGTPYKEYFEWLVNEADSYRKKFYPELDIAIFKRSYNTSNAHILKKIL